MEKLSPIPGQLPLGNADFLYYTSIRQKIA